MQPTNTEINTIVSAIEYEANLGAKPLDWIIHARERHGKLWKVFVEPSQRNAQLDESLEGAAAWWPGPPKGSADVLSVVPEELQINLRYATADVPAHGKLRVYPIRFLDKLAESWSSPFRGPRFYQSLEELKANSGTGTFATPDPKWFSELRAAQRDAFRLLSYRFSFLWGPPGTGKTHTLGTLLASFLVEYPDARVLLLSTTNTAVDLALVSVDRALERISGRVPGAAQCRQKCKRIGAHFLAQHYEDRQHLIPRTNENLIRRLAELESMRPDAADVQAFDAWKSEVEDLRNRMRAQAREVLKASRLAALTCTRGTFSYADLEDSGPFDLVVFDEASQVGLAQALPFLPLAQRVLFAGDPKQLEPIVIADDKEVREWLGRSPFEFMRQRQSNTTILTEQSRMVAEICRVVGETFYDGRLTVCPKATSDPGWKTERVLQNLQGLGTKHLCSIDVATEGEFHAGFRGYMREESAEKLIRVVREALKEAQPTEVAVLTPYRAQRTVIRKKLRDAGIRNVQVSTVHRAQGSEKRTVFFDPVLGTHQALTDRLINVALSRAKARLIVAFSKGDIANPRLAQIQSLMSDDTAEEAIPIGELLRNEQGLLNFKGRKVSHRGRAYRFEGLDASGEKILLRDFGTGVQKSFVKSVLAGNADGRSVVSSEPQSRQAAGASKCILKADGATPLGRFLREKIDPKDVGRAKVGYKDRVYLFLGFDSSGDKLLLQECSGGPIRKFTLEVVLAQTAEEKAN